MVSDRRQERHLLLDADRGTGARLVARGEHDACGRAPASPILMTALATVGRMVPLALAVGARLSDAAAAAIAVIGGIIASMALSLVITPACTITWRILLDGRDSRLPTPDSRLPTRLRRLASFGLAFARVARRLGGAGSLVACNTTTWSQTPATVLVEVDHGGVLVDFDERPGP